MSVFIHETAIVEEDVIIGNGTSIWDSVHIRRGTTIGEECIIGDKTHIAYDISIGNRVKINSFVNICPGVTIEDGVMISSGATFTNDRYPRAATTDLKRLRPSEPDDSTLETRVCEGATIGANATVGCGITIGRWAIVGMGSVVTRPVPPFHLVIGTPARSTGCVCRCGRLLHHFGEGPSELEFACPDCSLRYLVQDRTVIELTPP
jgi:acetyltransferase-like isoleucine patch superfamily enzyme